MTSVIGYVVQFLGMMRGRVRYAEIGALLYVRYQE